MKKTPGKLISAVMTVAVLFGIPSWNKVHAVSEDIFVYGAGLNEKEKEETAEKLGIDNIYTVKRTMVTGKDYDEISGTEGTPDSTMISSVFIKNEGPGSGINVKIGTPSNITSITEFQYENACITAGLNDIDISIASVKEATGESALAAIYKAMKESGESPDEDRIKAAQKELSLIAKLTDKNSNDGNFSSEFTDLIVSLKKELLTIKGAEKETILSLIKKECRKRNIGDKFTESDYEMMALSLYEYYKSASDDLLVKENLDKLSEKLVDSKASSNTLNSSNTYLPSSENKATEIPLDNDANEKESVDEYENMDKSQIIRSVLKNLYTKIDSAKNFKVYLTRNATGGTVGLYKFNYVRGMGVTCKDKNDWKIEYDIKKFEEELFNRIKYNMSPIEFVDKIEITREGTSIKLETLKPLEPEEFMDLFPGYVKMNEYAPVKIKIDINEDKKTYMTSFTEVDYSTGINFNSIYTYSGFGTTSLND